MLSTKLKAAAGNSADATLYVDDVFSTWLYTGNGSTQTITNGIDLAGKGGMVWCKSRSTAFDGSHFLNDTARGVKNYLCTNSIDSQQAGTTLGGLTAFNSNGFSIQWTGSGQIINENNATYASWTFRKAAKFFDVVTWTGDGTDKTINHNLGVAPGMICIKKTNATGNWWTYHRSLGLGPTYPNFLYLNTTGSVNSGGGGFFSGVPTSSQFFVGPDINTSGDTFVAYLFAHDTSSTGIIQCGSVTTTGGNNVNLGWEPQYILWKRSDGVGNWAVYDSMRGFSVDSQRSLSPNVSDAESGAAFINPTATGFYVQGSGQTIIYLAIRRPNKPPTSGTQVFGLNARTGTGANATVTGGQTDDAVLIKNRGSAVGDLFASRLTGTGYLETSSTAAEVAAGTTILQANPWDVMDGVKVGTTSTITNASANTFINYFFKRAPGFFDVVCYTGTGVANSAFAHNLGVTPEMMIFKRRNGVFAWSVYHKSSYTPPQDGLLVLNLDFPVSGSGEYFGISGPTSTNFYLNLWNPINASGGTYVAYLFATLAGISKVGSYTGNGTTQTINCGFTGGARFVLIKRTDSNGDWYVFDTARGMTTLTDPYLLLNSTAAEVATLGAVTSVTTGFAVNAAIVAAINTNAASYIFLAIA